MQLVTLVKRDQGVACTAMIYIHRYFVANSMAPLLSDHARTDRLILAAAAVFLAGKLRN